MRWRVNSLGAVLDSCAENLCCQIVVCIFLLLCSKLYRYSRHVILSNVELVLFCLPYSAYYEVDYSRE